MEMKKIAEAKQFDENRFTKIDMMKTRKSVAFVLNFLPGQEMRAHDHPGRILYLLVLDGEGTMSVDGEQIEVVEGNVIYCEADEKIGFVNTSDNRVSIYATMTKVEPI